MAGTMNEHITEKLSRHRVAKPSQDTARVLYLPPRLNPAVKSYYQQIARGNDSRPWPADIPSSAEILDLVIEGQDVDVVDIQPNRPYGPWESKDTYLSAHYNLLREDAVRPLREAVCQVRTAPQANEDAFSTKVGVYEKVKIIGFTPSSRGFAVHITFSTRRCGKAIAWSQTNRLMPGSLVALTPSKNSFTDSNTVIATVAARPASFTDLNPPELDLFFARAEEVSLDPSIEWMMVEARGNLYEASKHVLMALKHMSMENTPMTEHFVSVKPEIDPPKYIQARSRLDLTSVLINNKHQAFESVDVLKPWPPAIQSELDVSQLDALRCILTSRLAIVQGPPGTGKTFVSVKALQIMLANRDDNAPPIIVACQTNHAIDQILRHVADFEASFARLGGFSKDEGVIKTRTLHELRKCTSQQKLPGCLSANAYRRCRIIENELQMLLKPLNVSTTALDPHDLLTYGLLTEQQVTTLIVGASRWVQAELIAGSEAQSPFHVWLATKLRTVPFKPQAEDHGFEFEQEDPELEQLLEAEAEAGNNEDPMEFGLNGERYKLADNFTCANVADSEMQKAITMLAKQQDMWKIPEAVRSAIYLHLQTRLKTELTRLARFKIKAYDDAVHDSQIGRFEKDETILREQKLIGMTTTGLNKYRGLISALGCKVVLIEEAAETLEAPVITACIPTLEHLVLVGDHKQLRPHCQVNELESKPWWLSVSFFERMFNNGIGMTTLSQQRRMIPEIRRLLRPIYGGQLKDHPAVLDRPDVPGMGGINSFFYSHIAREARDELMSFTNPEEAAMIAGFVEYLVKNGTGGNEITIITFYRGQYSLLARLLRRTGVIIATVDSYQGEENKVVILSTVRSNETRSIGFLSVDNRTCVALSRAKNGFYIFGNALLLSRCPTWGKVIKTMAGQHRKEEVPAVEPVRFHDKLPIHCQNHGIRIDIANSSDWTDNCGGCMQKCPDSLACGHKCPERCHPYSHDIITCPETCKKELACGHKCKETCSKACACDECPKVKQQNIAKRDESVGTVSSASKESWQSYAVQEVKSSSRPPRTSSKTVPQQAGENVHRKQEEVLIPELDLISLEDSSGWEGLNDTKTHLAECIDVGQKTNAIDPGQWLLDM